jgi:hypothetical protein
LLLKAEEVFFLNDLSNSIQAVRLCREGRQAVRLKTVTGEIMTQYLVAIRHPDNFDPSIEGEAIQLRSQSAFIG